MGIWEDIEIYFISLDDLVIIIKNILCNNMHAIDWENSISETRIFPNTTPFTHLGFECKNCDFCFSVNIDNVDNIQNAKLFTGGFRFKYKCNFSKNKKLLLLK